MTTRKRQLNWLLPGHTISQDQELIDFVHHTRAKKVLGIGAVSHFASWINFVDAGPADLCIYIETKSIDVDHLIDSVNRIINLNLVNEAWFYLSFNKYQILPRCYDKDLPEDFDDAIGVYVRRNVDAHVYEYKPCGLDGGNRFNWVHPLTRFYLRKHA